MIYKHIDAYLKVQYLNFSIKFLWKVNIVYDILVENRIINFRLSY